MYFSSTWNRIERRWRQEGVEGSSHIDGGIWGDGEADWEHEGSSITKGAMEIGRTGCGSRSYTQARRKADNGCGEGDSDRGRDWREAESRVTLQNPPTGRGLENLSLKYTHTQNSTVSELHSQTLESLSCSTAPSSSVSLCLSHSLALCFSAYDLEVSISSAWQRCLSATILFFSTPSPSLTLFG